MSHTPGPWRSDGQLSSWLGGDLFGATVRYDDPEEPRLSNPICVVHQHLAGRCQAVGSRFPLADARLIAAAPELLAACKTVMNWNDRVGAMCTASDMRDVLTPLMEAIAK